MALTSASSSTGGHLLVATDDGYVRVWGDLFSVKSNKVRLASSFLALPGCKGKGWSPDTKALEYCQLTWCAGSVTMSMTCFQNTSLAVAGGSCGLSMWDLVEEKRSCYHEAPTPTSRVTAICQVNSTLALLASSLPPPHASLQQTDGANAGLASCVVTGTSDGSILVYDVRVGRGSSGLKAVTSLHNAHSEEVQFLLSLASCMNVMPVTADPGTGQPQRSHWRGWYPLCMIYIHVYMRMYIHVYKYSNTHAHARTHKHNLCVRLVPEPPITIHSLLSQSICFRAAPTATLKCGTCALSRCARIPLLATSRAALLHRHRVQYQLFFALVEYNSSRPSEHLERFRSW